MACDHGSSRSNMMGHRRLSRNSSKRSEFHIRIVWYGFVIALGTLLMEPVTSNATPPQFDGSSAFTFLYRQVEMGPRNPGSDGHRKALQSYLYWFEECGAAVYVQEFQAEVHTLPEAGSPREKMRGSNVIATFGTAASPDYILCAHYDTRPWADEDPDPSKRLQPIPGANDGASGVAVLLEMARLFALEPPPVTVQIVLFDLEDSGVPGDNESYCLGSGYFARHHSGPAPIGAVLLDMVGDADLEIPMEWFSWAYAREWTTHLFDLAEEVDAHAFLRVVGDPVYDDHVPLLRRGIPTVDLIDFNYPYWHTHQDTPEACSPESLEQVGRVLVRLVYGGE